MRMIDADALKKDLSEFNYDMALRIVDIQPTIEPEVRHGRWISVEDALPDATDTFFAIVEANGEREYVVATYARYTGHWIDKECRVLNDVTHWMKMPEPPEKE
jgi:hypothetical protein